MLTFLYWNIVLHYCRAVFLEHKVQEKAVQFVDIQDLPQFTPMPIFEPIYAALTGYNLPLGCPHRRHVPRKDLPPNVVHFRQEEEDM